jgi:hypothetical protein
VHAWERLLRNRLPGQKLVLAGCVGDVYGYAPSEEMFDEGGYEVAGFCGPFGISSLHRDFSSRFMTLLQSVL